MQPLRATILVSLIMLVAILGITNPGGYTLSNDGKYKIYKRYIGVALHFYEISPVWVEKG